MRFGRYWCRVSSCFLGSLIAASVAFGQIDFSAAIVDLQKPGNPVLAKLHFAKDKRRLDMQPASDDSSIVVLLSAPTLLKSGAELRLGGAGRAVILDLADQTTTVLIPDQKTYFHGRRLSMRASDLYWLYATIHPAHVDDACGEWMTGAAAVGETCRKVGEKMLNGRSAVEYELSCYGDFCRLWIDRELHALIKRETKWNSTELRNILEGPLDGSLFEVPPGYTEGRPSGVIQRSEPQ